MFINGAHSRIVITLETGTVDDAAPAGITGDTVSDVGFSPLLTLNGESGISDQGTPQKDQIGGAVGEGSLTFIRIRDVSDRPGRDVGRYLPELCDSRQIRMPGTVRIGKVLVQRARMRTPNPCPTVKFAALLRQERGNVSREGKIDTSCHAIVAR